MIAIGGTFDLVLALFLDKSDGVLSSLPQAGKLLRMTSQAYTSVCLTSLYDSGFFPARVLRTFLKTPAKKNIPIQVRLPASSATYAASLMLSDALGYRSRVVRGFWIGEWRCHHCREAWERSRSVSCGDSMVHGLMLTMIGLKDTMVSFVAPAAKGFIQGD